MSYRYGRGAKTIQDMLRTAKAGSAINMDDVPPVLAASTQKVPSNLFIIMHIKIYHSSGISLQLLLLMLSLLSSLLSQWFLLMSPLLDRKLFLLRKMHLLDLLLFQ
jgi:hypothetical protein